MPKPNTWFLHLEGRRKSQAHLDDDQDSDIEIAQEKQSYKCPLTLRRFEHPLTSTVCPHSFERAAVEDFLKTSGGSASCPVPGCSQKLTLAVLGPDPVLGRDAKRAAQRAQKRRQEEEDGGEVLDGEEGEGEDDDDDDDDDDEEMADAESLPRKQIKHESKEKQRRKKRVTILDLESEEEN